MFVLQRQTDYALRVLKILAKKPTQVISLGRIADETKISFLFLQKIARKLRLAGLIEAKQGIKGGYRLTRPLKKINLREILKIMEGNCAVTNCIPQEQFGCRPQCKSCKIKKGMNNFNKSMTKLFSRLTLDKI